MKPVLSGILLYLCALLAQAQEPSPWYAGLGTGFFDVDFERSEQPHFNSSTLNLFAGYRWSPYLAMEGHLDYIARGFATDDDNFRSEFGAYGASAGLVLTYFFNDTATTEIYTRLGASYLNYDIATPNLGQPENQTDWFPAVAGGLRGRHFFVEYLNHGTREELYLEQIRAGFRWSF